MNIKTYFIRTYGCQMNELDSEVMAGILEKKGLALAPTEEEADLIIYNTCSVRDLAERKVHGKIGLLKKRKEQILGLAGCMAQLGKDALFKKNPKIDFVIGTHQTFKLSELLDEVIEKRKKIVQTELEEKFIHRFSLAKRKSPIAAYVSIMRGCNNFCTYCVVPYTRGREISRSVDEIVNEVRDLVQKGYKEITLLGQNVNSYGKDLNDQSSFEKLLEKIDAIPGKFWIRFLTSNPHDITSELMVKMQNLSSICEFLHFPLQSGSNRILKMMGRKYSVEDYLEKVEKLRSIVKNVELGTDIIVGFPQEEEEDFLKTYELIEKIGFSQAFIFIYSPRKNTYAFNHFLDDVSKETKKVRHQAILDLYEKKAFERKKKKLGEIVEVLVEGETKNDLLKAKSRSFDKVLLKGSKEIIGTFQKVKLVELKDQTFLASNTPTIPFTSSVSTT